MDWLYIASIVTAALFGALALLVVEVLFIIWYLRSGPPQDEHVDKDETSHEKYRLPEMSSKEAFEAASGSHIPTDESSRTTGTTLSVALQFLFQQLRHETRVRRWLQRKLSTELAELLTSSTPGRLFESLTLRDLDLGTEFVEIESIVLEDAEFEPGGERLRSLDFRLDVTYEGSFRLDVDAAMLLGKTARISITVSHIKGPVRLRFSRDPYTHWALAFVGAPQMGLAVTGSFQGRQLRPRLAHIITGQIKRAISRRHTLPNYKIRYKPFFVKIDPGQMDVIPDEAKSVKPKGNFQVTIVEVTRLHFDCSGHESSKIYCTVALDSYNWVSCRDVNAVSCLLTLDIVITKTNNRTLGIVFKQVMSYEKTVKNLSNKVVIETVLPLSPAYKADLRRGDVIIAVDGKKVNNMNHVAKLIKGVASTQHCFIVRVERIIKKSMLSKKIDSPQEKDSKEDKFDGAVDSKSLLDIASDGKRTKSNSFSFRRVSEVMEGVGIQRLRGSPSKSDVQETDAKSTTSSTSLASSQSMMSSSSDDAQPSMKVKNVDTPTSRQSSPAISFTRHSDTIQIPFVSFGLRKRRCSVENKTSSDSSTGSTPTASGPSTPLRKAHSRDSSGGKDPVARETRACSVESILTDQVPQPKIAHVKSADDINMTDKPDYQNEKSSTRRKPPPDSSAEETASPKMTIQSDEDLDSSRAAYEYIDILQIHNTKSVNFDSIVNINDSKKFRLCENHKYLNINVWAKVGPEEEVLLGYINIPLVTILSECRNSKLGHHIKQYSLLPPDVALTISKSHPLMSHSGFEPCLCYGDILLSFVWSDMVSQGKALSSDVELRTGSQDLLNVDNMDIVDVRKDGLEDMTIEDGRRHDFLRTHFHRSTQCDFCSKKIWLKDAMQCRTCAMCCHKKCVQKCQNTTSCIPSLENATVIAKDDSAITAEPQLLLNQPEILMTEHFDLNDEILDNQCTESGDELDRKDSLDIGKDEGVVLPSGGMGSLLAAVGGSLRRVGSAHSLAPSRSKSPVPPRSLPPSPSYTPRKQSLSSPTDAVNPFEVLPSLLESPAITSRNESLEYLLAHILQSNASADSLLSMARDTGKLLFNDLLPEERTRRILELMADVRETLASQSAEQAELGIALSNTQLSIKERSDLSARMALCEGRGRALTALMLYCCAAAQNAAVTEN